MPAKSPPSLADELLIDAETPNPPTDAPPKPSIWLLTGLLLIAVNLRPALASLSPLLKQVRAETGLSATGAGLLTTAPVICLGLFGMLAPRLAERFGSERSILAALFGLALGVLLRSVGDIAGLFAGTIMAGAGIGICGVLLPGIVKRDYPHQAGLMTGLYTMTLCLGAALAAGGTVPISDATGGSWQISLAFWALPALLAAVIWWPQAGPRHHAAHHAGAEHSLWRKPLAWQVTGYMGFQSSHAYIVFGWLPVMLIERGLTPLAAGLTLSVTMLVQLTTALGAPWLASFARDQRSTITLMLMLSTAGFLGCLYAPLSWLWVTAAVLGLGMGGMFSMVLTLIVLRASNAQMTARLSSMAQGVGYLLASLGPLAVGLSRDASGNWHAAAGVYVFLTLAALLCGLAAGRERQL